MEDNESLYEEIQTRDDNMRPKTLQKPFSNLYVNSTNTSTARQNSVLDESYVDTYVNVVKDDEAEDIYEVIPADIITSMKVTRSREVPGSALESERTDSRGCSTTSTTVTPGSSPQINGFCTSTDSQYAEIFHFPSRISEIIPSRPTRESENPILRQDFAQLTETYGSTIPELKTIRETLAWINKNQNRGKSKSTRKKKTSSPFIFKRSLSTGDARCSANSSPAHSVYENSPVITPDPSPGPSPRTRKMPVYENLEFPFLESDRESLYSNSTGSSNGETQERGETNLYENLDEIMDGRGRTLSNPIDIVYSDLQFPNEKVEAYLLSSSLQTSSSSREEFIERSRSLTPSTNTTPPNPQGSGLERPKSLSLKRLASGSLGLHLAKFVKSVPVQRSNDRVLQSVIHEALARRHEGEEISVNVEVDTDLMRISTNCPPWEVVASFDIEAIGHVNLYEGDDSVLGVIVCPPAQDAMCYIIKCNDAKTIYATVKKAFRAPNLRSFTLPSPSKADVYARPGDEDFTSIPHITYLGCVKVKKSYLVINDSIATLLDKLSPRDYRPITLKIRPDEIVIVDERTSSILHTHNVAWVLSLGVFNEDSRLFGYIVSEARQGEKTRMFCHAFRCGRVTASVTATETIRLACQAMYSPGRRDSIGRTRRNSTRSNHSSSSSLGTSLERTTTVSSASSVQDVSAMPDIKPDKAQRRSTFSSKQLLKKLSPARAKNITSKSFRHYMSEPDLTISSSSTSSIEPEVTEEKPAELPEEIEEQEEREYSFQVAYLCSTVTNPPLRPKHVRDCVKQYQKELGKVAKHTGVTPPLKEVTLHLNNDGVTMIDPKQPSVCPRFFPFPCISEIKGHKDFPEYFAFSTVVSGDSKHKCHVFKDLKGNCEDINTAFEFFLWEKV
ncbi:uncharacterized protein LOC116615017 [Nematostella vectensis]|uniref:uncharacterized protein LOC116615017 n=1 Tax=Nematostella vectensis TaxID=45351 RepID=UPI0020776D98|nr:uncharacterized protein LOC116615017 [Nematostella vectensis]